MSMSSTDSRVTTSTLRRPESKRPRKDVSVSFKQIPDTDTEESVKMNHSEDGSEEHKEAEEGDACVNGKLSEHSCDDDKKEHSDENNTKL